MRKLGLAAALAASVAVAGCSTAPGYGYDPYYGGQYGNPYYGNGPYGNGYYGNRSTGANVATGAAVGAATGAVAGAVIPGVSAGQGAIAGAILGGVLGATVNGRQYYRDTRGYCYYVDQYGQPHYSYDIRC
jgi:predicted small secreted protein